MAIENRFLDRQQPLPATVQFDDCLHYVVGGAHGSGANAGENNRACASIRRRAGEYLKHYWQKNFQLGYILAKSASGLFSPGVVGRVHARPDELSPSYIAPTFTERSHAGKRALVPEQVESLLEPVASVSGVRSGVATDTVVSANCSVQIDRSEAPPVPILPALSSASIRGWSMVATSAANISFSTCSVLLATAKMTASTDSVRQIWDRLSFLVSFGVFSYVLIRLFKQSGRIERTGQPVRGTQSPPLKHGFERAGSRRLSYGSRFPSLGQRVGLLAPVPPLASAVNPPDCVQSDRRSCLYRGFLWQAVGGAHCARCFNVQDAQAAIA